MLWAKASNSSTRVSRDPRQVDRLALDAQAAGVEAGEVEELAGELRQAVDLLAHANEELPLRGVVEILVGQELQVARQGEERGSELVRRVRDELPARMLQAGEALPHAVEGAGELAELVGARVHDRLVELPARDPLGTLLEPADAPGEEPRASVAEKEGGSEGEQRRDQQATLDEGDAVEGVLDRARDEDDVLRVGRRVCGLGELEIGSRDDALRSRECPCRLPGDRIVFDPAHEACAALRDLDQGQRVAVDDLEEDDPRVRGRREAGRECVGRSVLAQRFGGPLCDVCHLVLPRVDEAVFERRNHDQVHEREHRRHDQEQGQGKPGADRLQVAHGSRSR